MHIIQKLTRPVVAVAVAFGLAAGAASALDGCSTCPAPAPVQPVYYAPAPVAPVAPVVACNPCAGFDNQNYGVAMNTPTGQYQNQSQYQSQNQMPTAQMYNNQMSNAQMQNVQVQQTAAQQGYQPQMQLQVPTQSRNTGINYLIPSATSGMVESAAYNPPMNEVDSYYSSHYPWYRR